VMEVAGKSEPDKVYEVRCKDGHYSCNCKAFIFCKTRNSKGDKFCKHINRALFELDRKPKPQVTLVDRIMMKIHDSVLVQRKEVVRTQIQDLLDEFAIQTRMIKPVEAVTKTGVRRVFFDD